LKRNTRRKGKGKGVFERRFGYGLENLKGFFNRFSLIRSPGTSGSDDFALFIKETGIKKLPSIKFSLEKAEVFTTRSRAKRKDLSGSLKSLLHKE
jgi:hypothetical protein